MIPGLTNFTGKGGFIMKSFYMGIDVSKGCADFMIINRQKKPVTKAFSSMTPLKAISGYTMSFPDFWPNIPAQSIGGQP